MKKILIVIGTRPNFIKVTQFQKAVKLYPNLNIKMVHTGQHYDKKMAEVFFEQFELLPDFFLNISGASANTQIAEIMLGIEKTIQDYSPNLVVVVGDVNSTLAAALTAHKMNIPLEHLESGLRSFDKTMPEEINRILTDEISDYFFITEQSGYDHLIKDGKQKDTLFFVGNTMIDTMVAFNDKIVANNIVNELNIVKDEFVLMTIHRPATVDFKDELKKLIDLIKFVTKTYKVVFPIHPRTINNLKKFELYEEFEGIKGLVISEPMDYFSFQKLITDCKFILTDSGGIQEESTFCLKPCITLRPNTERPSTVDIGTNVLLPFDLDVVQACIKTIENGSFKKGQIPSFWDGKSTQRIVSVINSILSR